MKLRTTVSFSVLGERVMQPLSTQVFVRALTAAELIRLLLSWPTQTSILKIHKLHVPNGTISGPLLWPARLATDHPHVFFLCAVVFMLLHLFIRRNYLTAALFSVLMFNLLIITMPTGDGADVLAFMMSVWCIFLVPPKVLTSQVATFRVILYNIARLACMLQFVFLYAASGVDKLTSNAWTTGRAFEYIRWAGGMQSPEFPSWLETPFWDVTFAWLAILLETAFGVLIWFRSMQPILIVSVVLFHLGIWWMLDLPDFSLMMIVAVLIFVRDDQYLRMFKPQLLST